MNHEDRTELTQELKAGFCSTDPIITRRFAEATFFSDTPLASGTIFISKQI